jgi:zinc resistance-associated protein
MKKLLIVLGGVVLVASLAVPLLAHGPGWSTGHHMGGYWGSDSGSLWGYDRSYGELSSEQRGKLEELDRKFYEETNTLRNEIWAKSAELNSLLNSTDPDHEKLRAVQRELSELRTKMDDRRLSYELEARKILPESRFSGGYGRGFYGHHMRGFGHGLSYAPGSCWD